MDRMAKTAENKARKEELKRRLAPRMIWPREAGTALRVENANGEVSYVLKPPVEKHKFRPTEAQDNAMGRAKRRRFNKALRGWRPYAQR